MTYSSRARYEQMLARAGSAMFHAKVEADALGDEGAREDLEQMRMHVRVLMEDSLKSKKHRQGCDLELRGHMTVEQVIEDIERHADDAVTGYPVRRQRGTRSPRS